MTPRVELIYDPACPHVEAARAASLEGFAAAGLRPAWHKWDRTSPDSPHHATRYGSPTILVEGQDVEGGDPADGTDACRVYDHGPGGLQGVPPAPRIAAALRAGGVSSSARPRAGRAWWRPLAALPGAGAALLPVGFCPACWPVYAGILGSLGLGFLLDAAYLLPITAALLALALLALGFRATTRRGYMPLALGIASAGSILLFKFAYASAPLVNVGLFGLVSASVWNAWPKKATTGPCSSCAQ